MLKRLNKKLFLIILGALLLRLWGINHGFPFIFSADEPALIRSALGIRFNPNPEHFDWPHLHFYLNFFIYVAFAIVRSILQDLKLDTLIPIINNDKWIFYLISRIFDAFLGTFTLVPLYLIGKKLFNEKVGLLAALALAVFPYHVFASHFALIDVPMVFWFTWSLYFCAKIVKDKGRNDFILAGIFAGLSASTKYNGGFGVFVIILAYLLIVNSRESFKKYTVYLVMAALASVLAFYAGTPYALFDYKTFTISENSKGAFWQFENVGKVSSSEYLPQLWDVVTVRFTEEFGYSYLLMFGGYLIYLLISKKSKEKLLIALPGLFYFLYVTSFDKNRIHYYMITFPFMALYVGYLTSLVIDKLRLKLLILLVILLVYAAPVFFSIRYSRELSIPDTRNMIIDWLNSKITPSSNIYYIGGDIKEPMLSLKANVYKIPAFYSINSKLKIDYLVVSSKGPLSDKEKYDSFKDRLHEVYRVTSGGRMGPTVYIFTLKDEKNKIEP